MVGAPITLPSDPTFVPPSCRDETPEQNEPCVQRLTTALYAGKCLETLQMPTSEADGGTPCGN